MLFAGGGIGGFFYLKSETRQGPPQGRDAAHPDRDRHAQEPGGRCCRRSSSLSRRSSSSTRAPIARRSTGCVSASLSGLFKGGADVAFEDSITRAREVKVKEENIAFAQVASFLFQGDTVGAAGLLAKWDGPAGQDPWYQLLAGATLERAGRRARQGSLRAGDEARSRAGHRPHWAHSFDRGRRRSRQGHGAREGVPRQVPGSARRPGAHGPGVGARSRAQRDASRPRSTDTIAKGADLPLGLRAVPHALAALLAADKRDYAKTKQEVQAGLNVIDGPGMASWLGIIALSSGDESLARKAALAAVGFSAVYPPARVLAARVALLGDRLDEALKATEELDPTSPDVAVVRAAAAYERIDATSLGGRARRRARGGAQAALPQRAHRRAGRARWATPTSTQRRCSPSRTTTRRGPISSRWTSPSTPGTSRRRRRLPTAWKGTEERPLRALRMSRLSRYQGKLDDADKYSQLALDGGTVTTRSLIERVFVLAAREKPQEAGPLLAKYPLVLGTLSGWLGGYAKAASGKEEDARGRTASLEPPPPQAPAPRAHRGRGRAGRHEGSPPRRRLREGALRVLAREPGHRGRGQRLRAQAARHAGAEEEVGSAMGTLPPRSSLAAHFVLSDDVVFLNHGSFGAAPRAVLEAQPALRARLEHNPMQFLRPRSRGPPRRGARAPRQPSSARRRRSWPSCPTPRPGVNTVLRSLALRAGRRAAHDEPRVQRLQERARRRGRRRGREGRRGATSPSRSRIAAEVLLGHPRRGHAAHAPRARRSRHQPDGPGASPSRPSPRSWPARGVDVLVDGAHAPGMVPARSARARRRPSTRPTATSGSARRRAPPSSTCARIGRRSVRPLTSSATAPTRRAPIARASSSSSTGPAPSTPRPRSASPTRSPASRRWCPAASRDHDAQPRASPSRRAPSWRRRSASIPRRPSR